MSGGEAHITAIDIYLLEIDPIEIVTRSEICDCLDECGTVLGRTYVS
jgi:hypothetical protein